MKAEFDSGLGKRFLQFNISIDDSDFIFEIGQWQIHLKEFIENETAILIYYDFELLNEEKIHSSFLKEFYCFDEKLFLRFEHTVFWYALAPETKNQ